MDRAHDMRNAAGARRSGHGLVIALLASSIVGVLGTSLIQRAVQGSRIADGSRDRLVLRLLAESAASEAHLRFQEAINDPATGAFRQIREGTSGQAIAGIATPRIEEELRSHEVELDGSVSLETRVTILSREPTSSDPSESCGIVRIEAAVTLAHRWSRASRSVRLDHEYRVARTTLPDAIGDVGLMIVKTRKKTLPNFPSGSAAFARVGSGDQTLKNLVTSRPPDGLQPLSAREVLAVARTLTPGEVAGRAQFVTSSPRQLESYLGALIRADLPVNGVIHNDSTEPLRISVTRFKGRCVISSRGPIEVGDIRLEDPSRDRLTLVSGDRVLVLGRTVEASLVSLADPREGVVFGRRAHVIGSVLSTGFPRRVRISAQELADCRISAPVPLAIDPGAVWFVAVSPHPVRMAHGDDLEDLP